MKRWRRDAGPSIGGVLFAALVIVASLAAPLLTSLDAQQAFGRNKIQYQNFDWHVLRGAHVDVYYYPEEEQVARVALAYAEESYDYLVRRLDHRVADRIPIVIYASHSDFEQTNVLPFVPPEGVLGVTEYLKRRVTLPFGGSYSEFRHTLRHELVHVFQLSLLTQQATLYPRAHAFAPPLWWTEGLAEYLSSDQDSRDEMIVRDVVLAGRMPSLAELGLTESPIVYPIGGELHHFLAQRYGDWRIRMLYTTLATYPSFDDAVHGVYGRTPEQLTTEWHYALRQRYFPGVDGRAPLDVAGREIAELSVQPVSVVGVDSSVDVAYMSPRSGYTNIYLQPLDGGAPPSVVVAGERSPEFESFHPFSSRIDSRKGVLLFASKFEGRDAIFFWDIKRRRVVGRYAFESLVALTSPAWSPDGRRVAFSGLTRGGTSDLYVMRLPGGELTRVTDDRFEDTEPTWLPDGRSLVFSSDRAAGGDDGVKNLYRVDIESHRISRLTSGHWRDESPRWDRSAGRVLFTSDRDGTFNLYSVDTLGRGRRETHVDGGLFDPAPVPEGGRAVVTGFGGLTWAIYAIPLDSAATADTFALAPDAAGAPEWSWMALSDSSGSTRQGVRYRRSYSLDFAAGGATAIPGYGAAQGGVVSLSDLLGDHQVTASLATYGAGSVNNIFDNLNVDLFYLNQQQRLNWGAGVFRTAGEFFAGGVGDLSTLYTERSTGVYGALRYPLSVFRRVEGQVRLEYSNRNDFGNDLVSGPLRRRGMLVTNLLSTSSDNTLHLDTGPIDGSRWNVSGGVTSDVTHGVFENWLGLADYRRYFRTSLQSAIAVRAYGYVSEGTRPRAVQVGGPWLLRGYPRTGIAGTRAWVASTEWRFPIIDYFALGLPSGPLRLPQLQGGLFNDLGQAWYKSAYDRRVLGAAGAGFRMALVPGLVLRLDVGRRYSFAGRVDSGLEESSFYKQRFTDFFFGYNY